MFKPFFAKGKASQAVLSRLVPAGAFILPVDSVAGFAPGDRIFCAGAGGSKTEYLGVAAQVSDDGIRVSRAVKLGRDAGALVFRPVSVFQWPGASAGSFLTSFHSGIAVERAVDGGLWPVRVADAWREDTVEFPELNRSTFNAFRAWLEGVARGGLEDFGWVGESGEVARVRLLDCDFNKIKASGCLVDLLLRLAVLEEGGYA